MFQWNEVGTVCSPTSKNVPVLQANRHHHALQRVSELTASQGIHTDKCCYYFADQKAKEEQILPYSAAVSAMTVNNQLPKAYLQSLQLK